MEKTEISPEMRLFSPSGRRLYANAPERAEFLKAAAFEEPENSMYCHLLHYTGCRPSEALELIPSRVLRDENLIVFRSLKKRKTDSKGRIKQPKYRAVPVPPHFMEQLGLVFRIRQRHTQTKALHEPLWDMSRPTAYRMVKRVMKRAGIEGPQATGKGMRHGFGVAMVTVEKPVPIHVLSELMGHSDSKVTEVYLQVIGEEKHKMVIDAWGG